MGVWEPGIIAVPQMSPTTFLSGLPTVPLKHLRCSMLRLLCKPGAPDPCPNSQELPAAGLPLPKPGASEVWRGDQSGG